MTRWDPPGWRPSELVPGRLYAGQDAALSTATIAQRAAAATANWASTPALPRPPGPARAWVLVGGAGLLGARIAAQLLAGPGDAPVVIVARHPERVAAHWTGFAGPGGAAAMARDPRLQLVAADITAADGGWLGQVPAAAVVMHLAGVMHALAGWRALAPVNLGGLLPSVRLARRDGALLQLASTLSVFVSSNLPRADGAAPLPADDATWLHGGYAQTRAAAEFALARAGVRWQVMRYGLLIPEDGVAFPRDHFAPAFLAALRRLGAVPDRAEASAVDLTPVDRAAAAALRLAGEAEVQWRHCANPEPAALQAVLGAIEAATGPLPTQHRAAWLASLGGLPALDRALLRAAFDKAGFLAGDAAARPVLNVDLFQATQRRFVPAAPCEPAIPSPDKLLPGLVRSMLAA